MKAVGIVAFVVLVLFCVWLVIDTVIYSVKKIKAKKDHKKVQEEIKKDDDVING